MKFLGISLRPRPLPGGSPGPSERYGIKIQVNPEEYLSLVNREDQRLIYLAQLVPHWSGLSCFYSRGCRPHSFPECVDEQEQSMLSPFNSRNAPKSCTLLQALRLLPPIIHLRPVLRSNPVLLMRPIKSLRFIIAKRRGKIIFAKCASYNIHPIPKSTKAIRMDMGPKCAKW